MDWLEDFFVRKQLGQDAIEIESIEEIEESPPVLPVIRKPRKLPRRPAFYRAKFPPTNSTRFWLEWFLIPLAIGQFWWLALLSLPALSAQAQCSLLYDLSFVDLSDWRLPNSENLWNWLRK
ncbi:hypothetical protein IQ250_08820 [Pseudanabaenaceae cyanobacterium LEGE 13415]|nr:hypothetical protein [Pseudanabaenaceae cyanobacterium LEGE 13415]